MLPGAPFDYWQTRIEKKLSKINLIEFQLVNPQARHVYILSSFQIFMRSIQKYTGQYGVISESKTLTCISATRCRSNAEARWFALFPGIAASGQATASATRAKNAKQANVK